MQIPNGTKASKPTQKELAMNAVQMKVQGHERRPPRDHIAKYDAESLREIRKTHR